ncbi:protein REPRESSOR OF SILENCING 3-like [Vigna umbellata]|uniref:protein REPRESSOR OF SILENCING 3-like n=1 Tax=Vigna umbellata TaxID=87088 RepID=UPI001F5EF1B0|nr:protein REPRESSOR OF SILENCING 3-like [Vigna umbellata]
MVVGMAEEVEESNNAVRIFVGGLAETVSIEDLRSLFSSLGSVQAVQTIRTKGRSFAYIDFHSDPKSLSKLFSKYNGCLWKGGRLRLEKAKEDYLTRMKREWEHEALDDATQPPPSSPKEATTHSSKSNTKHLNIFFPRLRKVKSIPFSGTGKHKYSFQNIKVPPLPVHFCDCEEHCSPFVTERGRLSIDGAAESAGMNDEEISIMNAVMNKLLQKEKISSVESLGKEKDLYKSPDTLQSDEAEDSTADEDDLIINMETKKNKTALIGNQELERILENQESWFNKTKIAKEEHNNSMPELERRNNSNPNKNKKRKSLPKLEMESNAEVSTTPGGKGNKQTLPNKVGSGAQRTEPEDGLEELTKVSWSQKSSWKELLGGGGNTSFSASIILPKSDCSKNLQRSDDLCAPVSTISETENMEKERELCSNPTITQVIKEHADAQSTHTQVIKELAEAQPANREVIENVTKNQHNVAPNKTGSGASWLQKQSWTQMVSENSNSFSIAHILPGITFPEPKAKEPIVVPAISNHFKHNGVAKGTINEAVSNGGFKSRETIQEKSQHISGNDVTFASVVEEKVETSPREKSPENIEIGETCSFMRSAASLKEWAKAKAAISGSLKRKSGEK